MNRRSFVRKSCLALSTTGVVSLAGCSGSGGDNAPIKIVSSTLTKNGPDDVSVWGAAKNTTDEKVEMDETVFTTVEFLDGDGETLYSGQDHMSAIPAGDEFPFEVPHRAENGHLVEDYNVTASLFTDEDS